MNPGLLILLALVTPFGLCLSLLAPLYLGMLAASYIIYMGHSPHPLANRLDDVFYIVDVYTNAFSYWQAHITAVSVLQYSIPVIVLPLIGLYGSYWLTRRYVSKISELFHLAGGQ